MSSHSATLPIGPLRAALDALGPLTKSSRIIAILDHVRVDVGANATAVRATDLETTVERIIPGTPASAPFTFAVPFDFLSSVVKNATSGDADLHLSYDEASLSLELRCSGRQYRTSCAKHEDFPKVSEARTAPFTVDAMALKAALRRVLPHRHTADNLRPAMAGVFLDTRNAGHIQPVCVNAHSLCAAAPVVINGDKPAEALLPAGGATAIIGMPESEELTIEVTDNQMMATDGEKCRVWARLIDSKYVDWPSVIPQYEHHYEVRKEDLLGAMRAIEVAANKTSFSALLKLAGGEITIEAADLDMGREAKTSVPVTNQTCPDYDVCFNVKLVPAVISAIPGDVVRVNTSGNSTRAHTFQAPDGKDLALLMPLMMGV